MIRTRDLPKSAGQSPAELALCTASVRAGKNPCDSNTAFKHAPTQGYHQHFGCPNDTKMSQGQSIYPSRDEFATHKRVEPHRQPIGSIPTTTCSMTGGRVKRQPYVRLAAPKVQGARHPEQVQNNSCDATVLDTLHQRPQRRRPKPK